MTARISPEVSKIVKTRADHRCEMCGTSAYGGSHHHRRVKGMGGDRRPDTNMPANLILLCGSGTTGCHGWVHSHVPEATELGLLVSKFRTPADVPVTLTAGLVLLDDYGNYLPTEGQAA